MATSTEKAEQSRFASRRKSVLQNIKNEVAIFSAAPLQHLSRDQNFEYRQNSDFFYLTGLNEPHAILVLVGKRKGARSILYLRERNPDTELWSGETLGLPRAKRRMDLDEVRPITRFANDLQSLISGAEVIHYAPGTNPEVDSLIWEQLKNVLSPSFLAPAKLHDSRLLTSIMRLKKDKLEIQAMRHVCKITTRSFSSFLAQLSSYKSEKHAASTLESMFAKHGADGPSFETIIAAGKNATTLHHHPGFQPLWKRELVLIDAGARYRGYAGDVTRTVPVQGRFSENQARVYDIVQESLACAIDCCRPGSTLDKIHAAAVRRIIKGLLELGILEGSVAQCMAKDLYKPYYMHQTSHWLGLDVHDISPITCDEFKIPSRLQPLEPGMVFTVEPGLYFQSNDKSVPLKYRGIGIRLEEDILITKTGCEVLTSQLPVIREDVEKLIG